MKKIILLLTLITLSYADISGTVFRDLPINGTELNKYGIFEDNEFGVEGVTVKAYNANGEEVTTATSAEDGTYNLSISEDGNYPYRV